jgi:hypothetical protein
MTRLSSAAPVALVCLGVLLLTGVGNQEAF